MSNKNFSNFTSETAPALSDTFVGYRTAVSGGERRTLLSAVLALFQSNEWASAPATSSDTGTAGQRAYDGSYLYICVATNTWRRCPLDDWS